ncbi:MAG: PBP1A family penicillin-binding protein [Peptococcia bacterium]|jgi:penicillin-binding protein 1A
MARQKFRTKLKYGRILTLAFLLVSFIIIGAGLGFVVGALRTMPSYDLNNITGELSSMIYDKDDKEVMPLRTEKKRVELSQTEIPEVMKQAIIAIEDQRFEKHFGIDLYRLGGAILANIREGYGAEGASTITQQLVKNAILKNHEKKMRRKIQELYIALQLEMRYSKEQILAFYLNNICYGHGTWSVQTASQLYFGKDAKDLTLAEAAMLAGVINRPTTYSPYNNPEKAKQRRALVLNEMVKMNYITQEEADEAKEEPFNLAGLKSNDYRFQSFVDVVIEEAAEKLHLEDDELSMLYTAGYRIYTTMDTKTQEKAEEVYANDKNFPAGKKDKIIQSAMVVLDPHSGGIRTIIGGRNQQGERQFNRAVDATRQPGSAMKPVAVYGPALEKGYSPATVLDDYPEEYDSYQGTKTFVNFDNNYRGLISMRTALQYSVNTVAVKMLQRIGVAEGLKFAQSLGITSLVESGSANDMGLSLALGGLTKGVSPLELTAAYGSFANEGIYVKPYTIRRIEDKDGNVIYENKIIRKQVMSAQTAYLMSDMLQTVVTSGTAPKAKLQDRPVAGKTGTTSFNVDAWFVGYTPDLVASVWLGYDKTENMSNVFGGNYGAPIWRQVMEVAHQNIPPSTFKRPSNIIDVVVDYKSGLLPSNLTPAKYLVSEKFNTAYMPTETSNVWVEVPVCADTGQILAANCPNAITGIYLKRPIPWTGNIPPNDAAEEAPKEYCTLHGGGGYVTEDKPLYLQGSAQTDNQGRIRSVRLNWQYLGEGRETYYEIYRSSEPTVPLVSDNRVAEVSRSSQWQDNNIPEADRLYYRVVAKNAGTAPVASNVITINQVQHTNNLKAPQLKGESSRGSNGPAVTLSWSKSSNNRPIVYYLFRAESPGFTPSAANQIAINENILDTEWTDTDVKKNHTYYYKVLGIDLMTNESSPVSNEIKVKL